MSNRRDLGTYFLLGLGIGIAAGVLWAPPAGGETRQLIADKVDESADYLRGLANSLKNLSAAVEAGKQAYQNAVSDLKTAAAGAPGSSNSGNGAETV